MTITKDLDLILVKILVLFILYFQPYIFLYDTSITNFTYHIVFKCLIPSIGFFLPSILLGNLSFNKYIYFYLILFLTYILIFIYHTSGGFIFLESAFKEFHFHFVTMGTISAFFCSSFYIFKHRKEFKPLINTKVLVLHILFVTILFASRFESPLLMIFGFNPPSGISILGLSEALTLACLIYISQNNNFKKLHKIAFILVVISFYYSRTSVVAIFFSLLVINIYHGSFRFKLNHLLYIIFALPIIVFIDLNDYRATSWLVNSEHLTSLIARSDIKSEAVFLFSGFPYIGYPSWQYHLINDHGRYNHDITSYVYQYGIFGWILIFILMLIFLKILKLKKLPLIFIPFIALLISVLFSRSVFYPNIWLFAGAATSYIIFTGNLNERRKNLHEMRSK